MALTNHDFLLAERLQHHVDDQCSVPFLGQMSISLRRYKLLQCSKSVREVLKDNVGCVECVDDASKANAVVKASTSRSISGLQFVPVFFKVLPTRSLACFRTAAFDWWLRWLSFWRFLTTPTDALVSHRLQLSTSPVITYLCTRCLSLLRFTDEMERNRDPKTLSHFQLGLIKRVTTRSLFWGHSRVVTPARELLSLKTLTLPTAAQTPWRNGSSTCCTLTWMRSSPLFSIARATVSIPCRQSGHLSSLQITNVRIPTTKDSPSPSDWILQLDWGLKVFEFLVNINCWIYRASLES